MNLLIIGNGLDLDLGLPTKYTDFLDFTNAFIFFFNQDIDKINEFDIYNHSVVDNRYNKKSNSPNLIEPYKKHKKILEKFDKSFSHKFINKVCKDFFYCVNNNCWIQYFNERYKANLIAGENWIDIENELQNVIHSIESKRNFEVIANPNKNSSFNAKTFYLHIQNFIHENKSKSKIFEDYYRKIKITLLDDFDKFIMALGIYLDFFVGQLKPNVEKASKELINMMTNDTSDKIDCVLSFNYKSNFMNKASLSKICYVHGSPNYVKELNDHIHEGMSDEDKTYMDIKRIIERNKMIVGFDDLQNNDENFISQNAELEFIDYHKYFQRIYKGTDSQYVDWLNEYKEELKKQKNIATLMGETRESVIDRMILRQAETKPNQIFIFGHSLDATDNEIFRDIFSRELNDTQITIYYHDTDSRKRIITNLVKILTQPILVQKTKGNNPDIKFVAQTYKE